MKDYVLYKAVVEKVGDMYEIRVPLLDGVTQAESMEAVSKETSDWISLTTGADPSSFEVVFFWTLA